MIDWSQPHSLAKVTEDAGFTMSDVAFVSGLDVPVNFVDPLGSYARHNLHR